MSELKLRRETEIPRPPAPPVPPRPGSFLPHQELAGASWVLNNLFIGMGLAVVMGALYYVISGLDIVKVDRFFNPMDYPDGGHHVPGTAISPR